MSSEDIQNNEESAQITAIGFGRALSERYLAYALATIASRALPDVRDGMKPVQRRLLFAMRELKLDPGGSPKKCARIVGDVIGKYHPHGDTATYETLVRLAQDFSMRYPLIDGQGNFGNIDGDNAAAYRYTEARLTPLALALMDGLDEDAVDFEETYDGEEREPKVLPASFPALLANGVQGIAVGMATSIPPHNLGELIDGLLQLISKKSTSNAELLKLIKGPDFPTGGTLVDDPLVFQDAYETGRGSFRLRANWEVEKLGSGTYQIVVTEIPYQVQKSKLIERLANLIEERRVPWLSNVSDQSDENIRIVIEPKNRNVDPDQLMAALFKFSDLEVRVGLIMNVLDASARPQIMDLKSVLRSYLDHRQQVLVRRSEHRLAKIDHRLELLEGYLVAFLNIDEVIRIIREEDEPKQQLVLAFDLTEVQAEAILNMRLRALRKLEEDGIRKEHTELLEERVDLLDLLADERSQWRVVANQLKDLRKSLRDPDLLVRKTGLSQVEEISNFNLDDMVEKEPISVILSRKGWIRAQKGHGAISSELKYKDGDEGKFAFDAYTTDKILILSARGRFYTLAADKLPGGRGLGEPLSLTIDLNPGDDIVFAAAFRPEGRLLLASSSGYGFLAEEASLIAATKTGKQVVTLKEYEKVAVCRPVDGDHVGVVGQNHKLLIYPLEEMPTLGRGKGVKLQAYREGELSDVKTFKLEDGLTWKWGESRTRTETDLRLWIGKRASAGRLAPQGFPKDDKFD